MALAAISEGGLLNNVYTTMFTGVSGGISDVKEIRFTNGGNDTYVSLRATRNGILITLWQEQLIPAGWTISYPDKGSNLILKPYEVLEGVSSTAFIIEWVMSGIMIQQ